jgi:hypothetical protein
MLGVFFVSFLSIWIGLRNGRTRFAEPEAQLPEKSLALPHPQINRVLSRNPGSQCLAVPKIDTKPNIAGRLPENGVDLAELVGVQTLRPPGSLALSQSS